MASRPIKNDIRKLEKARTCLENAYDLVKEVFPGDKEVQSYFLDQLKCRISSDHGFLNSDLNIDSLIERLEEK